MTVGAQERLMNAYPWILINLQPPPLDTLVWLYEPGGLRAFVGARNSRADGSWKWVQCLEYIMHEDGEWMCLDGHTDDLNPTHWAPLPGIPDET